MAQPSLTIGSGKGVSSSWWAARSAGGVLALRAAARGVRIDKLALYEPPFILDERGPRPPADFELWLKELVASDRRGDAVKFFMTKGMGAPALFVAMMRFRPVWSRLKALAHTLPYDYAVMGDTVAGKPLSAEQWASVTAPTLVVVGEKTFARARRAGRALADVLVNADYRLLEGQNSKVSMKALAPVLEEFFMSHGDARSVDEPSRVEVGR